MKPSPYARAAGACRAALQALTGPLDLMQADLARFERSADLARLMLPLTDVDPFAIETPQGAATGRDESTLPRSGKSPALRQSPRVGTGIHSRTEATPGTEPFTRAGVPPPAASSASAGASALGADTQPRHMRSQGAGRRSHVDDSPTAVSQPARLRAIETAPAGEHRGGPPHIESETNGRRRRAPDPLQPVAVRIAQHPAQVNAAIPGPAAEQLPHLGEARTAALLDALARAFYQTDPQAVAAASGPAASPTSAFRAAQLTATPLSDHDAHGTAVAALGRSHAGGETAAAGSGGATNPSRQALPPGQPAGAAGQRGVEAFSSADAGAALVRATTLLADYTSRLFHTNPTNGRPVFEAPSSSAPNANPRTDSFSPPSDRNSLLAGRTPGASGRPSAGATKGAQAKVRVAAGESETDRTNGRLPAGPLQPWDESRRLAELINEMLVEQARLDGVDLS